MEREIEDGSWLVVPANPALMFDSENEFKWNFARNSLGFDMERLSPQVGHA
jgi:putative transcriptional regulator